MCFEWRRIEQPIEHFPVFINQDTDECYYAREYIKGVSFSASETNNLISNYKKDLEKHKNNSNLEHLKYYKKCAIEQYAKELSDFFEPYNDEEIYISNIPSSNCKSDKCYDDRDLRTLCKLKSMIPRIKIEEPLENIISIQASHSGGPRDINLLKRNYKWNGFQNSSINKLYLIDDVLTSGSHYKACKEVIIEHHRNIEVIGLFWSRAIEPDPDQY